MAEKIKQAIIIVLGVFFSLFAIMCLGFSEGDEILITLGCIAAGMAFACFFSVFLRRKRVKQQKELIDSGIAIRAEFQHLAGLQVSDFIPCIIDITADAYKFVASNINFSLPRNKVTDVCIKTKTEVQKQYVSSIGGAALGAALFGLAGAAYGGRSTAKTLKNISNFLVITYYGENETDIKTIIFAINKNTNKLTVSLSPVLKGDMSAAKKIVKDFNNSTIKSENISIDL